MELTVSRHCVAQLASGLSSLQQALMEEPKRVRIVDAPTGAGKTYAFQQALLQDKRILFIVPTRRLAQNVAASLINDLVKTANWKSEVAERKVQIWSSDQTAVLREQGVENIRGYRVRQMQELDGTRSGGEMIVAVPEVVSQLLHRRYLDKGQSGFSVFDVLDDFDHIVFDEFHTIEARGFGLAALFAKLASVPTETGSVGYGIAKVSLLSATPLDVKPVLFKLGVLESQIAELHEQITQEGRPLHGDVQLVLESLPSMPAVLQQHIARVRDEVLQNRQIVIIYNTLADLKRDLPTLVQYLKGAGIPASKVLVINSIDDSGDNTQSGYGFHVGRKQNPDDFSVLIATASVEIGVTFRAANVMLMEPGFAPMNFLQRYGRAARRGEDGAVIVRTDSTLEDRHPWLRELCVWIVENANRQVSIMELSRVLSQSVQAQFREGDDTLYFGSLPQQAAYTSGLYWQALLHHNSSKKHRGKHLLRHQPASSKHLYVLLKQFATLEEDAYYHNTALKWRELLFAQALNLRDIGTRVRVIEGDGRSLLVDRVWLERETNVMNLLPLQTAANGEEYFQLQGELDDELLNDRNRASRRLTVHFPHISRTTDLEVGNGLLREWVSLLKDKRDMDTEAAWEDHPEAMKAAEQLVSLTGLAPGGDVDLSASTTSLVL
ncbi:MAG: DEAD/DEAH box helicase [Pseudomonadota bacterium]